MLSYLCWLNSVKCDHVKKKLMRCAIAKTVGTCSDLDGQLLSTMFLNLFYFGLSIYV